MSAGNVVRVVGGKLGRLCTLASIAAGLALPGSALAADTYVDDSGADAPNTCHVPTAPCATIEHALTNTGMGEDVFIGGGTYTQTGGPSIPGLTLDMGKSLFGSSFNPPATNGDAIVDYGAMPPMSAPTIRVSGGNQVVGLTIRGDGDSAGVLDVQTNPTIQDNLFDSANTFHIAVTAGGAAPTITENTFINPNRGVNVNPPAGATMVTDNVFTGVTGVGATFLNTTGTSEFAGNEVGIAGIGDGVNVEDSTAVIEDNEIFSEPGSTATIGIQLFENVDAFNTSAALARNEILGIGGSSSVGVRVDGALGPVTLDSDIIARLGYGIDQNISAMTGGNVTANNVTLTDHGEYDAWVSNGAVLTLNSSHAGTGILLTPPGDCDVMGRFNNRGPVYPLTLDQCPAAEFATALAPMFVNPTPPTNDYHLSAASPLIDIGSPAAPPLDALDFDGDSRALDGNGDGTVRRDVGADEFVFTPPPPGGTGQTPLTPVTPAAPTGQRAAALKKCKKRRSASARRKCKRKANALPV